MNSFNQVVVRRGRAELGYHGTREKLQTWQDLVTSGVLGRRELRLGFNTGVCHSATIV
jgi:hypothetical protein